MSDRIRELREEAQDARRREGAAIHRADQSGAALREALAELTDGLNDDQAAYVRAQVDRIYEALDASAVHPDHYGEAAEHLWEQFRPAIARGVAERA